MGLKSFFQSRWFDPKFKTKVHILQFVLIVVIVALAIGKIVTRPDYIPMNRMDIVAVTMSCKTIIVLTYQLVTDHAERFKRWRSLRAYAILNTLEVFFWLAVVGLTFYGASMICVGVSCALGVFVGLFAIVMVFVCFWTAVVSWADFGHLKDFGVLREAQLPQHNGSYGMGNGSFSDQSRMK